MKGLTSIILLMFSPLSYAGQAVIFAGGGLSMGQQTLSIPGNPDSKFTSQGSLLEGGVTFSTHFQLSGEFGLIKSTNTQVSETYTESADLKYYSAKAAFNLGRFALGLGFRHSDITFKSLSTTSGYLESHYSGFTPMGHLGFNIEILKKFRTTLEGQYATGALKSADAGLPEVKFSEMSVNLKLFLLFD